MSTIPASEFVEVLPSVLNAGGNALVMNGVFLTNNTRVPIGSVLSFPSASAVSTYFGAAAHEAVLAGGGAGLGSGYFGGYTNCTQLPGSMLFTQYNPAAVAAYLRGGSAAISLAALQAISGTLTVVMDGYTHTAGSLNLSSATSFSAAAALIQTALTASEPTEASVTGALAPGTASFTASIAGNIMTASAVASGTLVPGVVAGANVGAGTEITSQLSGVTGGIGTYALSGTAQTVVSESMTLSYATLNVTVVASGTLNVGQTLSGAGVTTNSKIVAFGTGTGLTGTYIVDLTQTVASEAITASATAITCAFDSVSGAFVISSGITGPTSTAAFATGSTAAALFLTQATGAVVSQGAAAATPAAFMTALVQVTQNWATFTTTFDPDGGVGNVQKQAFAGWVNGQNNRYCYVAWDTDITPTESSAASSSLGYILQQANSSGTCLIYEPTFSNYAAFIMGATASIDFEATNGRITFAYKGQTGLVATVTNATAFENLAANGYNSYCAVATANQNFLFLQKGLVTGPFQWLDSYVNEIYLNSQLQLALMELLAIANSIPYNAQGYASIQAAMNDPIAEALNFGSIRAGITLSSLQINTINNLAGKLIAQVVSTQGWAVVIQPASPQVRQARQSPVIYFWYCDGESIQKIVVNSVLVQ